MEKNGNVVMENVEIMLSWRISCRGCRTLWALLYIWRQAKLEAAWFHNAIIQRHVKDLGHSEHLPKHWKAKTNTFENLGIIQQFLKVLIQLIARIAPMLQY